jgi:UDP-GlcNAc:undecaprenyl-phosphate/decaprenyl-phosphate GlcNAc-1-phosphate transferase
MLYLSTVLLSVFVTISLIPLLIKSAAKLQMVDLPGERKVHTLPIPRVGGLAIALGVFLSAALWMQAGHFVKAYLAGAGILVLFGLLDDMKGLGYKAKVTGQLLAAFVIIFYGGVRIDSPGMLLPDGTHLPQWISLPLSVVTIVGVTNAINLADGLDGLAGGISFLGFCCIGYLAYLAGDVPVLLLSLALAGALFGFLRYNTHPASLFMGDTGSQLLGFSAITLAVRITQGSTFYSPLLPLIILGFPVLDTLTVMVERAREGRPLFSADKKHFHHRLMRLGLSHAEAVLAIYLIQAALVISAILLRYYSGATLIAIYALFSVLIIGSFIVADRQGFQIRRYSPIGGGIKARLRKIRDESWVTRMLFPAAGTFIPLLFLWSSLMPPEIPAYVSMLTCSFAFVIMLVAIFAKAHLGFFLRCALYLTIPLLLFIVEEARAISPGNGWITFYHMSFGIAAFLVLLTLKYSSRRKGFQPTPMDFLIIFIAVVVPNLPDQSFREYQLGRLAVEIVVLLFGYEVLLNEFQGRFSFLTISSVAALALITVRGLL